MPTASPRDTKQPNKVDVRSSLTLGLAAPDRDLPSRACLFGQFRSTTASLQYQNGPARVLLRHSVLSQSLVGWD